MPIIPDSFRVAGRRVLKALGLLERFREARARLEREIFTLRQNRLTPREVESIYSAGYHVRANYGLASGAVTGWETDEAIKLAHAAAIIGALPGVRKVLVGGCSSGMGVAAFRRLGVEAWGFELSPDLDKIVLQEVKDFIRRGSMLEIPFSASDRFDCLVTTDVLEHIQLKHVDKMFEEISRLGCEWMAHLINHTAIQPDHMTLKPLPWWESRAGRYYRLRTDIRAKESGNPRIYGLNGDPLHVYTFWEKLQGI
jgi:hypothetical protein